MRLHVTVSVRMLGFDMKYMINPSSCFSDLTKMCGTGMSECDAECEAGC